MENVAKVLFYTATGTAAGLVTGVAAETVFPAPGEALKSGDTRELLRLTGETVAQLAVNGFLAYSYLSIVDDDVTQSLAFMYVLMTVQPNASEKLRRIGNYLISAAGRSLSISTAEVYSKAQKGNRTTLAQTGAQLRSPYR